MQKKTLNDYLFDTLDRLSQADAETIQTEIDKAVSIISVSEQILNVARLKLNIMQVGADVAYGFAEIDNFTDAEKESKKKLY